MRRFAFSLVLLALLSGSAPARWAAARDICFPDKPDIRACFAEPFATYWQANGGLPVFGYPLGAARQERNPDLQTDLPTQWTERRRLEAHPENKPPFDILLGRMGAERLLQLGRDPAQEGREAGPRAGCLWFETTGHNVCDQLPGLGFKSYWSSHGLNDPKLDAYGRSLQLFGLPLTSPKLETNSAGDTVLTQWFERARFEWHPDQPDAFKVLLGLLGTELRANLPAPAPPSVFGVEISAGRTVEQAARAAAAGASWSRYNAVLWSSVEAAPGQRDWARLKGFEAEITAATAQGLTPLVIVRGTPGWAQRVPGSACGPIKAAALDSFAAFMRELVARYSRPPFGVKYWELGNEPDAPYALIGGDPPFGCWGDESDDYYGGGSYAEMLKRVYPAVKQADPSAQVVVGGLLLDCDPTRPPPGKDCKPARFLEGILRGGGGSAFDIVAYHAYNYWSPGANDWDRQHPSWAQRGGALLGKLDFLKSVEDKYGVRKPMIMNEGGLLCPAGSQACPSAAFYDAQANTAVRLYTRAWANGLLGAAWYTLDGPGWREGGLLDAAQTPRPAYNTLKFMSGLLKGAVYTGTLGSGALEGYSFRKGGAAYQIYWTNDGSTTAVGLPPGTRAAYNKAGQTIAASSGSIAVGFDPVVIESAR